MGNPFVVALNDFAEAIRLAPLWLRSGWIDVVWRYRRTRLGAFWHTLALAAFILTIGSIWSVILRQSPATYFRYVTASMVMWGLIASIITEGTGILINGQSTALSVRFPYVAFALAHVWRALLLFAHQFVLYLFVIAGTLYSPGWPALLVIPGMVLVLANGLWMSLLVGMMCLRRRDLVPAISSAMQILMFVTPVFWPKDLLGPDFAFAADFNPLYHLLRIVRDPLLGSAPSLDSWLAVLAMLIIGSSVTLWAYGRYRNRIPYWY